MDIEGIFKGFREVAVRSVLICLIGALLSIGYHLVVDARVLVGAFENPADVSQLDLLDAKDYFDRQAAIFIDARSPLAYANGHIPGALNLPVSKFDDQADQFFAPLPQKTKIITYCSGAHCDSGAKLARMIEQHTGRAVGVFVGGWVDWTIADFPVAVGEAP